MWRQQHLSARAESQSVQGVWRQQHLSARADAQSVQGMWRAKHLSARGTGSSLGRQRRQQTAQQQSHRHRGSSRATRAHTGRVLVVEAGGAPGRRVLARAVHLPPRRMLRSGRLTTELQRELVLPGRTARAAHRVHLSTPAALPSLANTNTSLLFENCRCLDLPRHRGRAARSHPAYTPRAAVPLQRLVCRVAELRMA